MPNVSAHTREGFDEARYCTEFTTDGVDETTESEVFGAFVCPRCGYHNAMTGEPRDFSAGPVRCLRCRWVVVLVSSALEQFVTEVTDDA